MAENLAVVLKITLAGMGIVFGAIVLFWGLMALLVRVAGDRPAAAVTEEPEPSDDHLAKQVAAAAAVAAVVAQTRKPVVHVPPTAIVSAWQAVMRSGQMRRRGPAR